MHTSQTTGRAHKMWSVIKRNLKSFHISRTIYQIKLSGNSNRTKDSFFYWCLTQYIHEGSREMKQDTNIKPSFE